MTIHYRKGCPWADGEIYMTDTDQTTDWSTVTCKHCLRHRPTLTPQERNKITKRLIDFASTRKRV